MPVVIKDEDITAQHNSFTNTDKSSTVFVNGKGIIRVGHKWQTHSVGDDTHPEPPQSTGSETVKVEGFGIARVGDTIGCGATNTMPSYTKVIAG